MQTPRFGDSYDEKEQPPSTCWYVEPFMLLVEQLGVSTYHLVGHHSGASLGTEMASKYPENVHSLCLIGLALMSLEDQAKFRDLLIHPYNQPVPDGSHLQKRNILKNMRRNLTKHGRSLEESQNMILEVKSAVCCFLC
jgi:pimeloyl-ACP methyl ester carboxylesterase